MGNDAAIRRFKLRLGLGVVMRLVVAVHQYRCRVTQISNSHIAFCRRVQRRSLDTIVNVLDEVDGFERVDAEAAYWGKQRNGNAPTTLAQMRD